jgi:hypothetical protein
VLCLSVFNYAPCEPDARRKLTQPLLVAAALTRRARTGFIESMRFAATLFGLVFFVLSGFAVRAVEEPRILEKVTPLPVALSKDFEFRKTKLYFLSEKAPQRALARQSTSSLKPGALSGNTTAPAQKTLTLQDVPITFERQYRLFGAVTNLDQRQRFGDYFDFFWRARRAANLTVRFEYRQEKLHSFVQAQEISYPNVHGTHKTEFKVIGDDYLDDGRVIAWRCLLIEGGGVVAENRSYMWE